MNVMCRCMRLCMHCPDSQAGAYSSPQKRFAESGYIFLNEFVESLSTVLHYPAGMGQRFNSFEEVMVLIELLKLFEMSAPPQAECHSPITAGFYLHRHRVGHPFIQLLGESFHVVVIQILSVPGVAKGTQGGDVEMAVELSDTAEGVDHRVDEITGEFPASGKLMGNPTVRGKMDGIGETNSGNSGTVAAGINSDEENTSTRISEEFPVELMANPNHLRIIKRPQYTDVSGNPIRSFEGTQESEYGGSETHRASLLRMLADYFESEKIELFTAGNRIEVLTAQSQYIVHQ